VSASEASRDAEPGTVRLMHVVTVPESFVFLRGQLGFMHAHGFRITGVSSPGPFQEVIAREEPIELRSIEMPRRITPRQDLGTVARLARAMRRVRPQIVHAHTPKGGLLGMLAARLAGVPVRVYHMRGLPFMSASGARRRLLQATERVACALADRVICVSHSLRESAIAHGLCAPEKIVTLAGGSGNGVDAVSRYAPRADDPSRRSAIRRGWDVPAGATVIAFIGRVVVDKGVCELAAAWALLRDAHPDAWLVLAGSEEPQNAVPPSVLAGLRRDPRVRLLGHVHEPRDVYVGADVVTLPTYREGFPNVLLEAAAMRRPVVSTRVPGCVDAVVEEETGLLVPAREHAALARALGRYLAEPALRAEHGQAARVRVLREFDQRRIWEALRAEYLALLTARGQALPAERETGPLAPRDVPAFG
jgi:glycosyltransferase involved in cell wall biosynthesis